MEGRGGDGGEGEGGKRVRGGVGGWMGGWMDEEEEKKNEQDASNKERNRNLPLRRGRTFTHR